MKKIFWRLMIRRHGMEPCGTAHVHQNLQRQLRWQRQPQPTKGATHGNQHQSSTGA